MNKFVAKYGRILVPLIMEKMKKLIMFSTKN